MDRDEAYRAVQRAAADAWDHGMLLPRADVGRDRGRIRGSPPREDFLALSRSVPFVEPLDIVFTRLREARDAVGAAAARRQARAALDGGRAA